MRGPLFRGDLHPFLMGAVLQRLQIGRRNVPVDDGSIGRGGLAAGDTRRLHGIMNVDAADQEQGAQNHPEKGLHDTPPVGWVTSATANSSRGRRSSNRL